MKLQSFPGAEPAAGSRLRGEKASNLRWKKLMFWPAKAARLNSSRRTRPALCPCWNSMTVPYLSKSVAICRYMEGLRPGTEPFWARPP